MVNLRKRIKLNVFYEFKIFKKKLSKKLLTLDNKIHKEKRIYTKCLSTNYFKSEMRNTASIEKKLNSNPTSKDSKFNFLTPITRRRKLNDKIIQKDKEILKQYVFENINEEIKNETNQIQNFRKLYIQIRVIIQIIYYKDLIKSKLFSFLK